MIQLKGELFEAVQKSGIFEDSKTFVDSTPRRHPGEIERDFVQNRGKPGFNLRDFVLHHFEMPCARALDIAESKDIAGHILGLWKYLERPPDRGIGEDSTLIPLPYRYIVPGGRFREIYYWDSYFTSEGLAASGRIDVVEDMVENFAYLIAHFGFVPNGNRKYYLGRSQPPFFVCMLEILENSEGAGSALKYLPSLEREYRFWMKGEEGLRTVRMPGGEILNRYRDEFATPREESYREDLILFERSGRRESLWRDIRSACESGWDFSSRWMENPRDLSTLMTTDIVPVCLNSLLYHIEVKLAEYSRFAGMEAKSLDFQDRAARRGNAIEKYLWDEERGFYFDYRLSRESTTAVYSLASVYPLFFGIAGAEHAAKVARTIQERFLRGGGLVTTLDETGEQWDSPNGWAPLQWLAVIGLERYGYETLAREIARRFVALCRSVFTKTGKIMEKYDVCDLSREGGGGEYPLQDGFGWTNGVVISFIKKFALSA